MVNGNAVRAAEAGAPQDIERPGAAARMSHAFGLARNIALGGLVATGILLAFASFVPAVLVAHRLLAESVLTLCVLELVLAVAAATYRQHPGAWMGRVGITAAAAMAYVTGMAAGSGEAGQEGRLHATRAVESGWINDPLMMLTLHMTIAVGAVGLLSVILARIQTREARVQVRHAWSFGLVALALVCVTAVPGVLASPDVPAIGDAEAVHAPWVARALAPFEATSPGLASGVFLLACAAVASLPLLDRGARSSAWRRVTITAFLLAGATFAYLTITASFAPPGH